MISRRNIRVKVMQLLYMIESAGDVELFDNPVNELRKQFEKTRQLFVYILFLITETARYAETDAMKRGAKNITTHEDLNVNIKIAGNEWVWAILENPVFRKFLEMDKPQLRVDKTLLRKMYQQLTESPEYIKYIETAGRERKQERAILQFLFTQLMLPNEALTTHLEEQFSNWEDDAEMMEQLVQGYLQKPDNFPLEEMLTEEKWQFGSSLLTTVLNKKEHTMDLIKPKLKNWDAERIAALDMILMRMGLCEFLYFETIPPKVTINEYIDLAKEYSTDQSGHFVNGVLDSLHKELAAGDAWQKIDFKKKTM
jgi:N utilization substance protein B